jgi:hypothetical protein
MHAQRGSSGCVQGHAREREGELRVTCAVEGIEYQRVKGGIEQCRVETEVDGVLRRSFGKADLREEVVAALPGGAEALEIVAIGEPHVG